MSFKKFCYFTLYYIIITCKSIKDINIDINADINANVNDTSCLNVHKSCNYWALNNECLLNPIWMEINCAKACNTCNKQSISFRNQHCNNAYKNETECYYWANNDQCIKNFVWMSKNCAKACKFCTYDQRCEPTKYYNSALNLADKPNGDLYKNVFDKVLGNQFLVDKYDIKLIHLSPPILMFNNFLPNIIVDEFLNQSFMFKRSTSSGDMHENGSYSRNIALERTSFNTWCDYGTTCIDNYGTQQIYHNLEEILGISRDHYEQLQVLNYTKDQFYSYHHDFLDVQRDLIPGPRILTFFIYLSNVDGGGSTSFPLLNLDVKPKKGMAILWPNILTNDPYTRDILTSHTAKNVTKGTKYAVNAWIHLSNYNNAYIKSCAG